MDTSLNISDQSFKVDINDSTNLTNLYEEIISKLDNLSQKAKNHLNSLVIKNDRIDNSLLETHQFAAHGFAWFETYKIGLRETLNWYKNLHNSNKATLLEKNILIFAFAEYLNQMRSGIMMSQSEIVRPETLGLVDEDFRFLDDSEIFELINIGSSESIKIQIVESLGQGFFPNLGLNDETLEMIQEQFKKSHNV